MAQKKSNTPSNPDAPIGIFDSGIGGLTVANAIRRQLPNESLIYFGDTAHLPYGDKSPDAIKYYSIRIAEFLLGKGCKMIVIACNTASAIAYEAVRRNVGNRALVINVIDPVVEDIAARFQGGKVGVIGTKATIKSNAYAKKLHVIDKNIDVSSLATPLLAPMIEEGFFNNTISKTVIQSYLNRPKLKKIQVLVLACTHYPLIKPELESFYHGKVELLDTAEATAGAVKRYLTREHLLSSKKNPKQDFFVSDHTKSFEESTRLFFGGKVKLTHYPVWESE